MTSPIVVGVLFLVAWLVFAVPVSAFLFMSFGKSRMSGFIWLFVAVVVWPAVARLAILTLSVPMMAARHAWPGSTAVAFGVGVSLAETVVGGALLLVAVIVLYRELSARGAGAGESGAPPPRVGMGTGI